MALSEIIWTKQKSPYQKPPPLHVVVIKKTSAPKVLAWDFSSPTPQPAVAKKNSVAVLSDGKSVSKITLYEEFADKITEGESYIIRGYGFRGPSPPYLINISKTTEFFNAPDIQITEELKAEAVKLISPPSEQKKLCDCVVSRDLVTIKGEVTEVSPVKPVKVGRDLVPLTKLTLMEEGFSMAITLWRDIAVTADLNPGDVIILTHMKMERTPYGLQMKSTTYTTLQKEEKVYETATVIGVKCSSPGWLKVLLASGEDLKVEEEKWEPYSDAFKKNALTLKLKMQGNIIAEILSTNEE